MAMIPSNPLTLTWKERDRLLSISIKRGYIKTHIAAGNNTVPVLKANADYILTSTGTVIRKHKKK